MMHRTQVGSAQWIAQERASALDIAQTESEEFGFSARNDLEWLNEHMAEIFSENQVNVAEIFKTPGKLRGKTPRTARKGNPLEARVPLSDVFSATPQGRPSPFKQINFDRPLATFRVAEDKPREPEISKPSANSIPGLEDPFQSKPTANVPNHFDSGYYGSQAVDATQATQPNEPLPEPMTQISSPKATQPESEPESEDEVITEQEPEERRSTEGSFQSAKEEQTRNILESIEVAKEKPREDEQTPPAHPILESPLQNRTQQVASPQKRSPQKAPASIYPTLPAEPVEQDVPQLEDISDVPMEDVQSPQSDASTPMRPVVRKSSLNFASLPAREPLTSKKSIGNRVSRTSQLEQSRTSHYGRQTGGKSIGHSRPDEDEADEMDVDDLDAPEPVPDEAARIHNKTSTQRLQDQISMLGKSQSIRPPSKSITATGLVPQTTQPLQSTQQEPQLLASPLRKERPPPGAFPDDEDDSWIGPSNGDGGVPRSIFSPRPQMAKSHSTDVMEDIHGKESISGPQFNIPKRGEERQKSPLREAIIPERTGSVVSHVKSVSTSVIRSPKKAGDSPESKIISVSNPNPTTIQEESTTPPKSPSRSYKGSPLKAAKDKFSSILKTSRGLFASSAAVSADAKANLSPHRSGLQATSSMHSLLQPQPSNPDLALSKTLSSTSTRPESPSRTVRKTRASTEREERKKYEEIREAKETKEAQKMNDQLEKARQKVKEDARVFAERAKAEALQKEMEAAARKEKESQIDLPRATRSSPRKTKAQLEAEGIAAAAAPAATPADDLSSKNDAASEALHAMPPPAVPRPKSQIGRPIAKRPLKPTKDTQFKAKPTVIRVDTGSQRGHQYHPSNATLSATLQDSLPSSQPISSQSSHGTLKHKASTSSIQSKASTSSFKSTGATKALEAAARKKEQEEAAAKKKREAKLEIERQRAAIKEEERRKEEAQRQQELERQREIQRERERATAAAEAKKAASRQAMEKRRLEMERAKETRPPPPAARPQTAGSDSMHEKALPPLPPSKASRMNPTSTRPQEEFGRSINGAMNSAKAPPKRPLQQEFDDHHSRPTMQRNGPSYQHHDNKRRKTSENFEDDDDMTENHPKMTAPPIRQSSIRAKEMSNKSLFPSGYATASSTTGNLQRTTLISQHNMNSSKPAHPMDMAQVSKAPIPFASSSSQYKTPARPPHAPGKSTAKSAKSSPRYQNGEHINLPEIQTDSEDDDDDDVEKFDQPKWVESPALKANLMLQEKMDPSVIFGPPRPLDMEAVFSKSKDKFHKFRARTSSANWDGEDRLTHDEIQKDIEARDKLRRQGCWTYDNMV